MELKTIEIDGNDGTGKSFLVQRIKKLLGEKLSILSEIKDRGLFTELTLLPREDLTWEKFVNEILPKIDKQTLYLIADDSVENCQKRILSRGDSIEQEFHNAKDLAYYREQYHIL